MSLSLNPSVVTNGLIFYYDASNTQKSWKGPPTVNLYTDPSFAAGSPHPVNGGGAVVADPRNPNNKVLKFSPSASNQYNGRDIAVTLSSLYSYQMEMFVSSDFNGTDVRMYPEQAGSGAGVSYNLAQKGTWQTLKYNGRAASTTNTRMLGYVLSAFTTGYVMFTNVQVEQSAFTTSFINGTRSNTQAIVDLTSRNTITASNLVYSSDNTFSYSYVNPSYLTIPLASSFKKTEGTMNFWVYPTSYNGGNGYFVNREDATANATDWFWIGPYSNTFYFRIGNGVDCCSNDLSFGSVSSVIPINTWTNMCFTWLANGTSAIYINGVLYTSRSIGNIPNTNPASNGTIGLGHANADNYFNGRVPLVQIYNRQLSAAEVLQNFQAHRGRYLV